MVNKQDKISITTLLFRHSPKALTFAVMIGAIAGALYSLIIPFVLGALNRQIAPSSQPDASDVLQRFFTQHDVGLFFLFCAFILLTKATSVILVNNIAKSAASELRINIAKKINHMMIDNVESVGFPRLLNILIDDVNNVAAAALAIPILLVSMVTVVGMLGYLAILNFYIFLLVLAAICLGVFMFQVPISLAEGLYDKARTLRDTIQEGIRGLVMGVYELKLSRSKSIAYIEDELIVPQKQSMRLEKIGDAIIHLAANSSDLLSFFIIGLVVFVLPRYINFPASESYGVVMVLLYIAGPVGGILAMLQKLKVGQVALAHIHALTDFEDEVFDGTAAATLGPWTEFRVQGVTYKYPVQGPDQENSFSLDPVSLSFRPGQINFIVGGNGSGKSTLSKLLSLHYLPAAGGVFFDGVRIDAANIVQARSRISVIFSNYHLFRKLYREHTNVDEARINSYLESLGLKGKTEFINGHFTTTKLSDGQRRRLALLVALLEDKDIYIFDEWAADQDPGFKSIFYRDILKDMKNDNKLVIVITHDDRYFDCADRVIFMEDGKMIGIKEVNPANDMATDFSSEHSFIPAPKILA